MKGLWRAIATAVCVVLCFAMLSACGSGDQILVISREAGSGTREAFDRFVINPEDINVDLERSDIAGNSSKAIRSSS